MNFTVEPIMDAYGKVKDFVVKVRDCEACARRREKIKQYTKITGKKARDFMRLGKVK